MGERLTPIGAPDPKTRTLCGLLAESSTTVTVALRDPVALGVKVTLIAQLLPTLTLVPQSLDCAKSLAFVPVTVMLEMAKEASPALFRVIPWGRLLTPTGSAPMLRLSEERLGSGPPPLPVRLTAWGLPEASSVMVRAAERGPNTVGWKITLIAQLAPAASELPQVLDSEKSPASDPETVMLLMLRDWVPLFVKVTDWAALRCPVAACESLGNRWKGQLQRTCPYQRGSPSGGCRGRRLLPPRRRFGSRRRWA